MTTVDTARSAGARGVGSAVGRRLRSLTSIAAADRRPPVHSGPRPPRPAPRTGTAWRAICAYDALSDGVGRPVAIDGLMLAVFRHDDAVHVVENRCSHVGVPLDDGLVADGCIVCPWHGWRFDLETGEHLTTFGRRGGLRTYPATVSDAMVWIEIVTLT